jgi:alginate O-acetyltransferase complex protein AlgI
VVGWTIFYYTDMPALFAHLRTMFAGPVWVDDIVLSALRQYALFLPLACVGAAPLSPRLRKLAEQRPALGALGTVFAVLVGLLSLLFLIKQSYNPFIYFRF